MKTNLNRCLLAIICLTIGVKGAYAQHHPSKAKKHLLVVTVTKGFRHDSIPLAEEIVKSLGEAGGWETDYARTDEDIAAKMTMVALAHYDGVMFANTTGVHGDVVEFRFNV